MGFLQDLFAKKPGGTVVGNIIRNVASSVTGGVLGTGAGIINQQQYDLTHMSDADYEAKYAVHKNGTPIVGATPNPAIRLPEQVYADLSKPQETKAKIKSGLAALKKFWYVPTAIGAAILGVWYFTRKKHKRY